MVVSDVKTFTFVKLDDLELLSAERLLLRQSTIYVGEEACSMFQPLIIVFRFGRASKPSIHAV